MNEHEKQEVAKSPTVPFRKVASRGEDVELEDIAARALVIWRRYRDGEEPVIHTILKLKIPGVFVWSVSLRYKVARGERYYNTKIYYADGELHEVEFESLFYQ